MAMVHHSGPRRRRAALTLLAIILTTVALSLSQCRVVDEKLTGVSLDSNHPDRCILKCTTTAVGALARQIILHGRNLRSCQRDSVCITLENIRFRNAVQQIEADRRACVSQCHHQGGGGGGR
jgi:hypothetical protein